MLSLTAVVFTYLTIFIKFSCAQRVFLNIPDGEIMGSVETTATNTSYFSFKGIPYAQPPIDGLRYQAPQPVQPWNDTLDATYEKSICYQVPVDSSSESEDCLHLNVFAPRDSSSSSLPVMVFIFGGGFMRGSGSFGNYGPQHFMDYDVIIVTFNYRLGPFGFFSTGDSEIPGNAGLKDQNMVLQWVQKNIQYFGGDPNKVTIFGQSAGAASVAYHLLSPKSKGLFRAAICESGSALSPWAYQRDEVYYTFRTAGIINPLFDRNNMSSSELRQFATYIMPSVIDKASYQLYSMETADDFQLQQGMYYGPVIEHDHEDAFITKQMYEEFKNGNFTDVPLIIGINSNEAVDLLARYDNLQKAFDGNVSLLVPRDMNIKDEEVKEAAGTEIKNLYSPNSTFEENASAVTEFFNDNSFTRAMRKQVEFQSNSSDVYFYRFAYTGPLGGRHSTSVEGFSDDVGHGEELGYLFVRNYGKYNTSDLSQFSDTDILVHRRFITLLTNFAKTLNPTPETTDLLDTLWPKVSLGDFQYLDIGSNLEVKQNLRDEKVNAWEDIYVKYGVPPYDTY